MRHHLFLFKLDALCKFCAW